jgi:hypothetical protein
MQAVRRKGATAFLCGLVAAIIATAGTLYLLARSMHVPRVPLEISRNFVDLIEAGDFRAAYLLTDQKASVGRTLAAFEANIRRQLCVHTFPTGRPIEMIRIRSGAQSYGNRLRRWIMDRKIDPDQVSVDYIFGLPFEVRLMSDASGNWQITFFQSHAM